MRVHNERRECVAIKPGGNGRGGLHGNGMSPERYYGTGIYAKAFGFGPKALIYFSLSRQKKTSGVTGLFQLYK